MWTICSSQYGGGRVTRRLNRNSWRSVTGIAARMSYSTLDFRFLIPRGHHCDRRVVNGIVFRTTAIFYLPTTHERRRGEEAVSRHRGREIVDPCGGVVERYSRIKLYKWVVIHFPWFWFMPPRGFVLLIHIKGACPRFKQSPTYLIFAFQACQPPRSQKGKNSTVDRFFVNRVWTDFQGLKSGSGSLILTKFRRISLTFFIIFFFFFYRYDPDACVFQSQNGKSWVARDKWNRGKQNRSNRNLEASFVGWVRWHDEIHRVGIIMKKNNKTEVTSLNRLRYFLLKV